MDTDGATGGRLLSDTVPLLLSVAPEVSVTVAVHMMVSALEARAEVSVRDEPLPKEEPVLMLVQAKLSVRLSLSSSLALTEQVRVLSLLGAAGLTLILLTAGAVFEMVMLLEVAEVPFSTPSFGVTTT